MSNTILSDRFEFKTVTLAFIYTELFDLLTTYGGLTLFPQMWEANPLPTQMIGWYPALLAKLLAVVMVVICLEKVERWPRMVWVVPVTAALPVIWNTVCILAEVLL